MSQAELLQTLAAGGTPAPPSLVGQTLGSYRVSSLLGEGGMGRVYLAEHTLIGRKVAIKVLSAEVAGHEDIVSRFFTEARSVNDIRHPNIVEVTDFGTHGNQPFIVMEYLEGETLEQRIEREKVLSPEVAARVTGQVASALGAAHDRGLVHRDLKPANLFLRHHQDYPDFVKVLDFGIAKLLGPSKVQHRTEVGQVIGTPAYMSPEQCLGDVALDQRSDIYSLGVVLYQLVTGRLPFQGDALGRLLLAHLHDVPPPPESINPRVPPVVSAVIARAMAKRPEQRFASMREFKDTLLAAVAASSPAAVLDLPGSGALRITPATSPHRALDTGPVGYAAATVASEQDRREALQGKIVDIVRGRINAGAVPLPTLGGRARDILRMTALPGFSFPAATAVISQDPRMRGAVFALANASEGAVRSAATSLDQAVARLGAQGLRMGLIEIAAREALEAREPRVADLFRKPSQHAIAVATLTQRIVQLAAGEREGVEAYMAGLLHDIGKPIVATLLLDVERQLATVRGRRWLLEPMISFCVEATHREVGGAVARSWGLPAAVAEALQAPADSDNRLSRALALADALAGQEGFFLRREDQTSGATVLEQVRRGGEPDERTLARLVHGVRDRVLRRA